MNEMVFLGILKAVSIFAGVIAFVAGLDLVIGAKVLLAVKKTLDKTVDFDKAIINSNARKILGAFFMVLSLLMLFLVLHIKA